MKRLTENKIFWAITALVLSFVFWLYVTSVESDTIRQTFRGVRVELVGETVLRDSRSLVVTGLSTNTVSLEITGPRRVVAGLSAEDLSVQIDVSKLSQSAYASMQYTVSYPARTDTSGLTVTRKVPDTINFTVSRLNSKTIPVRGSFDGSIAPGYTAEPVSFEPSEITVSGPEAYLRNISYAWCGVDSLKKESLVTVQENKKTNFKYFKLVLQTCKVIYTVIAGVALVFLLSVGSFYINSLDSSCILAWIVYSVGVALNMRYCYYTSFLLGVGAVAENNKAAIITKLVQIIASILLLYAGYGVLGVSIAYLISGITLGLTRKHSL